MVIDHFGLRLRPFATTPDTDAYYPASTHEQAIRALQSALDDEEGICILSGLPGTGKTLVCNRLLEGLGDQYRSIHITNTLLSRRSDLLQAALFDLGLPYEDLGEQQMRLALVASCLDHFADGGRTVVFVDEAHHLTPPLLEELRLLSNLEGKEGKAVQVVLLGLPALEDHLNDPALAALKQRITVRPRLQPLDLEESVDYLMHQVRRAGGRPEKLFGEDVLDILTHAAQGIPRLLNQTASTAMALAADVGNDHVDAEAAVEAVTQLGLDPVESAPLALTVASEPVAEAERMQPAPAPVAMPAPPPSWTQQEAIMPLASSTSAIPPTYIYGDEPTSGEENPTDWPSILHRMPRNRAG